MQEQTVCVTCFAVLPADVRATEGHEQWHDAIAGVAIESTKRIEQLEKRVQELEAGYADR